MSVTQIFRILQAYKWLLLLLVSVAVSGVVYFDLQRPQLYEGTAKLAVNYGDADPITERKLDPQIMAAYMSTQADVIDSLVTARKVVAALNLTVNSDLWKLLNLKIKSGHNQPDAVAAGLLQNLRVKTLADSGILLVTYRATSPESAARVTNEFVKAYQEVWHEMKAQPMLLAATQLRKYLQNQNRYFPASPTSGEAVQRANAQFGERYIQMQLEQLSQHTNTYLISPATAFDKPVGFNPVLDVLLAILLSVVVGVGIVFTIEMKSRRIRSLDDLADTLPSPMLITLE